VIARAEPVADVTGDHEVIRLSGAEPETFGRIFDRHAAAIHRYLARRAGRSLADDLTAETFLIAFRGRDRYDTTQPKAVAALFDAAATIPGTSVVHQADLAGRHGIAVSRTDQGIRHDLIFDSVTYHFLGERDVVVGKVPPYPKNAVIGWTAQLHIAIVDRTGQLP